MRLQSSFNASALLCLFAILGCGTSTPSTASSSNLASLAGNWEIEVGTVTGQNPITLSDLFVGALSVQGSAISGIFQLNYLGSGSCSSAGQFIPFTGSVSSSNVLTLTSSAYSGTTATIQFQLPAVGYTPVQGSAQVVGGSCSTTATTSESFIIPSITGSYTGTLTPYSSLYGSPSGTGGPATLAVTQGSENAEGQFPVADVLTFTSPSCTLSTTLTGTLAGLNMQAQGSVPVGSQTQVISLTANPQLNLSNIVQLAYVDITVSGVSSPSCPVGYYEGTLTF